MILNLRKTTSIAQGSVGSTEIEDDVNLNGSPTTTTQDRDDETITIATTDNVYRNRAVGVTVLSYGSGGQPLNTILVTLGKVGGTESGGSPTANVKVGDVLEYFAISAGAMWHACITSVQSANTVRIPAHGYQTASFITNGFVGGNVGVAFPGFIYTLK